MSANVQKTVNFTEKDKPLLDLIKNEFKETGVSDSRAFLILMQEAMGNRQGLQTPGNEDIGQSLRQIRNLKAEGLAKVIESASSLLVTEIQNSQSIIPQFISGWKLQVLADRSHLSIDRLLELQDGETPSCEDINGLVMAGIDDTSFKKQMRHHEHH